MSSKEDYFNTFPKLKSKIMEKYVDKDKITWLKCKKDVPSWLKEMFDRPEHKARMEALKKLSVDSMKCRVENN